MDPMQMQNPQVQIPMNQGQVPPQGYQPNPTIDQVAPQQYIQPQQMPQQTMPMPGYPVQQTMQQPVQQVAAPQAVVAQDDFFDKFLKGLVNFIGKLAGGAAAAPQAVANQVTSQPMMQQAGGLLGQVGSTIGGIATKAESGLGSVVQGAQSYVAQPEQAVPVNMQNFLEQNYQPVAQQAVAYQQPVQQAVVQPVVQPVIQQAPQVVIPQPVQQVVAQPIMQAPQVEQQAAQAIIQPTVQVITPTDTVTIQQTPQQPLQQ